MCKRWLLLVVCIAAVNLSAQTMPIDVELGYRWTDVSGNQNMYRTQVNEDDGLLLRALVLATTDFRLDVSDFGAGPAGALRLESRRDGLYRMTLRYRKADEFSALPNFAFGQHTFDRTRDLVDADLEILRWKTITPFVGYTWNRREGPGTTTWQVGQDEFLLSQNLRDTDRELRIGAGFELARVTGRITQGWRSFEGRETLTLAPLANGGNNSNPVLGRPITASGLTRDERTDVDTPFTSFYVTGQVTSKFNLVADYSRFAAEGDTNGSDEALGSFASFALGRFYGGSSETSSSRAKNTTWRGGVRAEFAFNEYADLTAGYRREHRELDGTALIQTLYLQTLTFGGADPRDVQVILNAENALERSEEILDAEVSIRPITALTLRVGLSNSDQDVTVTPDLSEIVVPGAQGGGFERNVRTLMMSAAYAKAGFTIGGSAQFDNADEPILRTDYLDRDRYRLTAAWKAPRFVRIGFSAGQTQQENDHLDVAYDSTLRDLAADLAVTPIQALSLRASASRFRADSSIRYRRPENFTIGESVHLERGNAIGGGLTYSWSRFSFDGDLTHLENEGSLPFDLDRSRARLTVQPWETLGFAAEWARDDYSEASYPAADYKGTRYGLFLRVRR